MALWVALHGFANGELVEQEVLNRPVLELKERTDYLYNQIISMAGSNPFESVRLSDMPLETTGDYVPAVKDIVCLNPETKKIEKALVSVDLFNNIFVASDASSLALGILVSVNSDNTLGVVSTVGKLIAADIGSWTVSSMLETGETFVNGPYYLSALEPGKLTANPSGPAIYIGQFYAQTSAPTLLDYALLNPQYKDLAEAHIHRAIPLYAQPAGSQIVVADPITGTHTINGFKPDSSTGAERCRLVITGGFNNVDSTQYVITLAGESISDIPVDSPGFDEVYLHWTSSDPNEPDGKVQLRSYETPVAIGTKGLIAILENTLDTDWDTVEKGVIGLRTWTLDIPNQVHGWLANKSRGYLVDSFVSTDQKYSFILLKGPYSPADMHTNEVITVKALRLYRLYYATATTVPTDGDTLTVGSVIYEFDDDGSITAGNILVPIGTGSTAGTDTFTNLMNAILEEGISNVDCAINSTDFHLIIGVADADTVTKSITDPFITLTQVVVPGPWAIDVAAGFLVYDKNHNVLVATDSYWSGANYWTPKALKNNLSIMVIPYDADGTPAIGDVVLNGDKFTSTFVHDGPGTSFVYNVAMHPALSQVYPPIPFGACSLVLNGVELDSYALFSTNYIYRAGLSGIYWLSNKYGAVPWPVAWTDYTYVPPYESVQNMVFHSVKMAVGNSSVVTSLQPAEGSPIRILKCGTNDVGTVGDLEVAIDLQLSSVEGNLEGYNVYKEISNNKLVKGPVVSQIIEGPGISISNSAGTPAGRGRVMISLASGAGLGGDFGEVALENAKQEMVGMFPYIQLLEWVTGATTNIPTGFTAKFKVPTNLTGNYRVLVYLTLFGEADTVQIVGQPDIVKKAGLEFSYEVLHDYLNPDTTFPYDNLQDDIIVPPSALSVEVPMGVVPVVTPGYIYNAYDPIIIHNNSTEVDVGRRITWQLGYPLPTVNDLQGGLPIPNLNNACVTSGSLVAIRVKRAGVSVPANEYTAKLGFINLFWRLTSI